MKKFFSFLLIIGMLMLNTAPVFAQLGDVSAPAVEAPPAPPEPPAEPAPAPAPEPPRRLLS